MPAVKMIPVRNEDNQLVAQYFAPSSEFVAAVQRHGVPMLRPDGKTVRVNKKLHDRGHYDDDKHNFTPPPAITVKKGEGK